MRVYHFTEEPFPPAWKEDADSLRVTIPNGACGPVEASNLYNRYLDEWMLADQLGFDIMVNEHHATSTCMTSAASVVLGILARQTEKARLLILGMPLANRPDPLRVVEELSMVDVISRGRLDMGFVKGVPFEIAPANMNPVRMMDRFWESHDLILKAMTSHDGPINWEGEYFHYRNVNVWPRPYQQPHPPVWITATSMSSVKPIAEKGYVLATMLNGWKAKDLFDGYRKVWRDSGRPGTPGADRFAYLALVGCGETEEEGRRRGDMVASYLRTFGIVAPPFRTPPGYISVDEYAGMLKAPPPRGALTKDGRSVQLTSDISVQDLIDTGLLFAGTPDQVYEQIVDFSETIGGLGNLLMMGQAGPMSHADTVGNLSLFAKEVLPRLKEYKPSMKSAAA